MTLIKPVALLGIFLAALSLYVPLSASAQEQSVAPAGLALDQAIAQALVHSPVLGASLARADAANASRSQAGALPNPDISIEAENIYGDGPYDGLDGAEFTYSVSQLVELPGKRGSRIQGADAERTKIHYTRASVRLDLIRDVTVAYAELAAAQETLNILEDEQNLATQVRDSVAAKVQAGKEPPIQKNKAEIERSVNQIALDRARRDFTAKKQMLSALMGGEAGDFIVTMDSLPPLEEPEALESYRARLVQTPDVKSLDADIGQAKAGLSLEKAKGVPDPTFNLGVRDFRESDEQAFIAGISLPLPVFNLNRAGVERAGHDLNAAMLDQRGVQLSLDAQLTVIHGNFTSAYGEASALKIAVLPGAEESFSFARQGYDAGKFGYLDVLDAQRTLFDARKQFNEAVLDYHRQRAAIERITAAHAEQHHEKEDHHATIKN